LKHSTVSLLAGLAAMVGIGCASPAGTIVPLDSIAGSREGLAVGPGGLFYGVGYNNASLFTLNPTTDAFTQQSTTLAVSSTLVDVNGTFYGITGGGYFFSFNLSDGLPTTLANAGDNASPSPVIDLTTDGHGNIYGVTTRGGQSSDGSAFEFNTNTSMLTTIGLFNASNGGPSSPPVLAQNGEIYGTGGSAFYQLDPSTGNITTLGSVATITGGGPIGDLVADNQGNLYGVTWNGGVNSVGSVFEANENTGNISLLASFGGNYGSHPEAGLIEDSAGDFFGTTMTGGQYGDGTVFEYDSNTNQLTTVASFDGTDGSNPQAVLIADSQGNLYGTTLGNGTTGTLFEVTGSGFVVPEPSTLALLGIGTLGLLRRRIRGSAAISSSPVHKSLPHS
jgi:uncharacterized repeat protein (TIGR03803 family)